MIPRAKPGFCAMCSSTEALMRQGKVKHHKKTRLFNLPPKINVCDGCRRVNPMWKVLNSWFGRAY